MRKSVRGGTLKRVHEVLLSLGYYHDKQYTFRRGKFHVTVKPYKKRVEILIHANHARWFPLPFAAHHRARKTGEDLEKELNLIVKAV